LWSVWIPSEKTPLMESSDQWYQITTMDDLGIVHRWRVRINVEYFGGLTKK
jgi:hypothetical protein